MRLLAGAASARACPAEWPRNRATRGGGGVAGALRVLLSLRGRSAWGLRRATAPQVPEASVGEEVLRGGVVQAGPFALGEPLFSPGIGMLMPASLGSYDC